MPDQVAGLRWRRLTGEQRRVWAEAIARGVKVDRVSEAILVTGPCPTCGHDFEVVLTDKEILAESGRGDRGTVTRPADDERIDWAGTIQFLVGCHCEGDHDGRPSVISHGCGASGWLVDES